MKNLLMFGVTLVSFCGSTQAFAADGERLITLQEDVAGVELIKLDVPAGDLEVVGITGNKLTAQMAATCQNQGQEDCYKLLKHLDWNRKAGSSFELGLNPPGITNYNQVTIKIKIGVPREKPLQVNLSAGELRIIDTSACLLAEVNAGEIDIKLPASKLASAELSAKVGDVQLTNPKGETTAGERSLLVGASLAWKGSNTSAANCQTRAKVLTGEARLKLE